MTLASKLDPPLPTALLMVNTYPRNFRPGPVHGSREAAPLPRVRVRVLRPLLAVRGARATPACAQARTRLPDLLRQYTHQAGLERQWAPFLFYFLYNSVECSGDAYMALAMTFVIKT